MIIGRVERLNFLDFDILNVPAKIDTGADSCSVWASNIKMTDNKLSFVLFDKKSKYYKGVSFTTNKFKTIHIRNSFGHVQERYKVKLLVSLGDQSISVDFTLADRSNNKYPALIGRNLLNNRYKVDVAKKNVHFIKARSKLSRDK